MHPAKSLIFFTTISGAGFGLIFCLTLLALNDPFLISPAFTIAGGIAVLLASAGLLSSLLHLGNPQRAWRALSQWKSSWLSREGVLAVFTLGCFVLWLGLIIFSRIFVPWLGLIAAVGAGATIFATAMIYTQLRPVPRWHTWLTPLCYLGFGLSSGAVIMTVLMPDAGLSRLVLVALVLAWLFKLVWWLRADKTSRGGGNSSIKTATGLTDYAEVKLFERPHMTKNYLMKEMVFVVGRKHARRLRQISLIIGGILPVALLGLSADVHQASTLLIALAGAAHLCGLCLERWLFFAEAEHAVGFYYGQN